MQPSQIATTQPATVIAKVQQPSRPSSASAQPASFLVVDDQQPGTSRQLMFTLSPAKTVNPPSVASGQQEESQHNTSGLSSLFGGIPSVQSTSRTTTHHNHFHPLNFNQHLSPVPSSTHQEQSRPTASPASRASPNQISLHQVTPTGPFKGHPSLPKTIYELLAVAQKQKSTPSNTYSSPKCMKKNL